MTSFLFISFLIPKNLKHIKFQKSKIEGTETGSVFRMERRLGNIFILIVLTFPHNEWGKAYHLFKSLVSSIIKGLRLAPTISFLFLGNWTSKYLILVYCHWKELLISCLSYIFWDCHHLRFSPIDFRRGIFPKVEYHVQYIRKRFLSIWYK